VVGMTNAVNLIDGLDGLAVGVATISSLTMLVIAMLVSDGVVALMMAALAGGCIGFMPYNLNPAKIFMGDTGSTFLGFILATASIQGLFKFYTIVSFAVPFLMLGLPLFDTCFAILRRVSRGQNPMSPDRSHVHHRLIDVGFNQKQAVAILYVISASRPPPKTGGGDPIYHQCDLGLICCGTHHQRGLKGHGVAVCPVLCRDHRRQDIHGPCRKGGGKH